MPDLKSEAFYRTIVENTQEGIWVIDAKARTRYVNPQMAAMLGYTVEEMQDTPLASYLFESDHHLIAQKIENRKNGMKDQYDLKYRRKDGSTLWTIVCANPLFGADGCYTGAVAQHMDISERKFAEDQLREKRQFLETVFNSTSDGVYAIDTEFRYTLWNPAMESRTGIKKETVIGKVAWEINPHVKEVGVDKFLRRALNGETIYIQNHRYAAFNRDGRFDGSYSPMKDSNGKIVGCIIVVRDTTELSRSSEALRGSQARLQMAMDFFHMGSFDADVNTGEGTCSDSLRHFYGFSSTGKICLNDFIARVHPEDRERISNHIHNLRTKGLAYQADCRIVQPNGETRWLHCGARMFYSRDGKPNYVSGLQVDITEQKSLEQDLDVQRTKMAHSSKLSALGEMASGIAHEINNPVAIIHGRALQLKELVEDPKIDAKRIFELAEKIESTALRISKIVKSLRCFARNGENDPFQQVPISIIIDETLEFCKERFRHRGVKLIYDGANLSPQLEVACRRIQISQLLLNLLNNAQDAVDDLQERWVKIDVENQGDRVAISVTDSGLGISDEIREKLFQPFFTTKEIGKGTGLGLSLSKGIADAHHGHLQIDSQSKNTRFVVVLPKNQVQDQIASKA